MASPDKETFVHRWFEEVWNKGRIEAIDELLAEGAVIHGLKGAMGEEVRGPEGFRPFFQAFHSAFPDIRITVETTVSEGNKIAAWCVVRGTHTEDGIGIAPTQKPIEFTGMCMVVVENGKMVEVWNSFDFLSFYQQLGVLPVLSA